MTTDADGEGISARHASLGLLPRRLRWVGIYDVTADEIAVIGWDGPAPPTHARFPPSRRLCGAAVASGETVVVGDVSADPRYLTTHATTRSEIVVPVFVEGVVVGLIDVESEWPQAFGEDDGQFLERCAAIIVPLLWRALEIAPPSGKRGARGKVRVASFREEDSA